MPAHDARFACDHLRCNSRARVNQGQRTREFGQPRSQHKRAAAIASPHHSVDLERRPSELPRTTRCRACVANGQLRGGGCRRVFLLGATHEHWPRRRAVRGAARTPRSTRKELLQPTSTRCFDASPMIFEITASRSRACVRRDPNADVARQKALRQAATLARVRVACMRSTICANLSCGRGAWP